MLPAPDDYPALLRQVDRWHAGVRARHPGVIPCRLGCTACCHGPFDISVADALLVNAAVRAMPEAERLPLLRRAEAQLATMRALSREFRPPYDVSRMPAKRLDALTDAMDEEPCPALGAGGECLLYEARPMVCRLMGIGIESPEGDVIENSCPIQDEFPAYRALGPQPCDLDLWGGIEALAEAHASVVLFGTPSRADYETTVAGAIVLGAG